MRATAVIGANYGDEGKGLITDYLASPETVVVRFNGGAQAGHTVVSSAGRHVFSHFGAGTFSGAETYLAKHFVLNPLLFYKEVHKLLPRIKSFPIVAADPRCYVTTPYDMIINQAIEDHRQHARHGSCGVGFGETIERNKYPTFRLLLSDLTDEATVKDKLRIIRDSWLPERFREYGMKPLSKDDPILDNRHLLKVLKAFLKFGEEIRPMGAEFLVGKDIIFEGAQGLALDMDSFDFPHVTRSNTGLVNVAPLVKVLNLELHVIYVTRTYLTRHGAGPLPGERELGIKDKTNVEHPYQGLLRFAPLDVKAMEKRINHDAKFIPEATKSIAVTCLDQVPNPIEIHERISDSFNIKVVSRGPKSSDVSIEP